MKSVYSNSLDIDDDNCVDLLLTIDFLQVEDWLKETEEMIEECMSVHFTNGLKLMIAGEKFYERFENKILEYYDWALEEEDHDVDEFNNLLKTTDEDIFLKVLKLLFKRTRGSMLCRLLSSWLSYHQYDILEMLPKIRFIFENENKKLTHKEKFKIYSSCFDSSVSKNENLDNSIFSLIFGDNQKEVVRNLDENANEMTIGEFFGAFNTQSIIKKLCLDDMNLDDLDKSHLIELMWNRFNKGEKSFQSESYFYVYEKYLLQACKNNQVETAKVLAYYKNISDDCSQWNIDDGRRGNKYSATGCS